MTVFKLSPAISSHRGMRRKLNEDAIGYKYPDNPDILERYGALFVVADGVGGLSAGDRASELAVELLMKFYYSADASMDAEKRLAQAVQDVNTEIFRQLNKQAATTIVAAVIIGDLLVAASVGDSLIFRIQGETIQQLNVEDVLRDDSADDGALTKAIGYRELVDVQTISGTISTGDKLLMCSDGLTRYVKHPQLIRYANLRDPRDGVRRLINEANNSGGADNVSVIVIHVGEESSLSMMPDHIARLVVPVSIDAQPMMTPDVPSKPHTQIPLSRPQAFVPDLPLSTPNPLPKNPAPAAKPHTEPKPPAGLREAQAIQAANGNGSNANLLLIAGIVVLVLGAILLAFAFGMAGGRDDDEATLSPTLTLTATNAPTETDIPVAAETEAATPDLLDTTIQLGDRLIFDSTVLTVARIGDSVASFVAATGTPYLVDNITEHEGQLWYRLVLEDSNETGWVAERDLPAFQLQRDS